ncbi:MAG: hypothetical protein Q4P79_06965 [Fusobacterium sp.]|nr:hypothetical protein [Fusobacterium sp.]MDO5789190.1 hypothetical protein [Fusobacterium sp.]
MANIVKDGAKMEFPLRIKRQYPASLDESSVWYSLEEAQEYASSGATAYAGQVISVVNESEGSVEVYKIKIDGSLEKIGTDVQIDTLSQEEAQSIIDKYKNSEE